MLRTHPPHGTRHDSNEGPHACMHAGSHTTGPPLLGQINWFSLKCFQNIKESESFSYLISKHLCVTLNFKKWYQSHKFVENKVINGVLPIQFPCLPKIYLVNKAKLMNSLYQTGIIWCLPLKKSISKYFLHLFANSTNSFVILFVYKTSKSIFWCLMNTFLHRYVTPIYFMVINFPSTIFFFIINNSIATIMEENESWFLLTHQYI